MTRLHGPGNVIDVEAAGALRARRAIGLIAPFPSDSGEVTEAAVYLTE
jgi:hypothetical protein